MRKTETKSGIQIEGMMEHSEILREPQTGSGIETGDRMKHLERYVACVIVYVKFEQIGINAKIGTRQKVWKDCPYHKSCSMKRMVYLRDTSVNIIDFNAIWPDNKQITDHMNF